MCRIANLKPWASVCSPMRACATRCVGEGDMTRGAALPLLAAAVVMLHGCGSAPDTEFKRRGTSLSVLKSDSDQCWKAAQKTNINEEEAAGNMVAGYFVGGLVGAMVASSANEEARKDP